MYYRIITSSNYHNDVLTDHHMIILSYYHVIIGTFLYIIRSQYYYITHHIFTLTYCYILYLIILLYHTLSYITYYHFIILISCNNIIWICDYGIVSNTPTVAKTTFQGLQSRSRGGAGEASVPRGASKSAGARSGSLRHHFGLKFVGFLCFFKLWEDQNGAPGGPMVKNR